MPQNLDYTLYFNIILFGAIGLGFIIGYLRGLKKTLYSLVVTILFYGLFFVTIELVINQLWILPIPFAFQYVTSMLPELAGAQTIGDAVFSMVEKYAGANLGETMTNTVFVSFVTGIAQFVLKIVYTILYFTIGLVLFKFFFYIFRLIFFKDSKKNKIPKYVVLSEEQINIIEQPKRSRKEKAAMAVQEKKDKKELEKRIKKMGRKEKKAYFLAQGKNINGKKLKVTKKQIRAMKIQEKKDKKELKKRVRKMSRKEKKAFYKLQKSEKSRLQKLEKVRLRKIKKPLFGAIAGAAKGAVTAFVGIIVLGGIINITESLMVLIPEEDTTTVYIEELLQLSTNITPLAAEEPAAPLFEIPESVVPMIEEGRDFINAYNGNSFIQFTSTITYTDANYSAAIPLNLFLFDSVFSLQFSEETIMLRNELSVFAETASVLLDSEYMVSGDLSDVEATEISTLFITLSESNLITSMLPLAIEVGSDYFDTPIEVPIEELYAIDWESELQTLGAVAAVGFGLVNDAGILVDGVDYETVTFEGAEVSSLFDSLADSELVTLAAYVAVEPLLEQMGGDISAIITVPEDIEWDVEFRAFGEVAAAVLDTGLTVADMQSNDPTLLIGALSEMDFTVLLSSDIVSLALKNIFDGTAGVEGLDMIVIPLDIVWFDEYDAAGNLIANGELRNILLAVNGITSVADGFDFDNLDFNIIADFDDPTIDTIFNSRVLVASISGFLLDMDLGDTPLVIPDSVLDTNGYLLSTELKAIASSARVLVSDLACDDLDTACEETGFDIAKAFSLSDLSIDTLTSSEILAATIGELIIDSGGDILVIPNSSKEAITVDSVAKNIIKKEEIKNLFKAVSVLGFTDLDTMTFDASIITALGTVADTTILDSDKSDKLFGSGIVHATISEMLFDLTDGVDSVLSVPYYDIDLVEIREYSAIDEIDYVSLAELENILQALLTLDITDFADVSKLDINSVIEDADSLLNSAILHATISTQMFDLGGDILTVPYKDEAGDPVRVTVGVLLDSTDTEYITKTEITNILDSLEILGITDINKFDGSVDLESITSEPTNIDTILTSATLHATISTQLINLDTDGTIVLPYLQEDNLTAVRVVAGDVGFETEYVVKTEIKAMIDALDALEILDIESFDGTVDLSLLSDDATITIVLTSSTIQATISDQLFNLDTDGVITLPYLEENGTTDVRVTVGSGDTESDYVTSFEIKAMIDAMDILGFTDVEEFTGTVSFENLFLDDNITTVLLSATIHATISKQLIDLDTDSTITLPFFEENDATEVRVTVGAVGETTEYVTKAEIEALMDAVDILGFTDLEAFTGTVSLAPLMLDDNKTTVLLSATIHATISQQLIDLDTAETINLPFFYEDNLTQVRIVVGDELEFTDTEYVIKTEIETMIDALDILGIDDVESFGGSVNVSTLTEGTNFDTIIASAMIQATISNQIIALESDVTMTAEFAVPFVDELGTTDIRVTVGNALDTTETEYIVVDELRAMIFGMETLGIDDVQNFDGAIDLQPFFDPLERDSLLESSIMQATISKQLIKLSDDDTLQVPVQDVDETPVRITAGLVIGQQTEYVSKLEIGAMFDALEQLGFTDINDFSGTIDLVNVYGNANQTIILASAAMHATISKQMADLPAGSLTIPTKDIDDTDVKKTVLTTDFIIKDEIKAIINVLELFEIDDINDFDGTFDFTVLQTLVNQNTLLSSAAIHATITGKMLELDAAVLVVPEFTQDGVGNYVRLTVGGTEFVVKDEIKALINAFTAMGYDDIDTLPASFNTSQFFDNRLILLASKSIQMTVSDKMLNSTGGNLIIPDLYYGTIDEIRIDDTYGIYIDIDEINAIFTSLEELGMADFDAGTLDFSASNLFSSDYDVLLASASIQATISENILVAAEDETTSTVGEVTLIVPTFFRQAITVASAAEEQITKQEIKDLLNSLDTLGLGTFGGNFDASVITTMSDADLVIMLASGSVHSTVDNMLRDNGNIIIPSKAEGTPYSFTMTTAEEVKLFILASQKVLSGGSDFTNVSFSPAVLGGLSAGDQDVVATSMIARATLTPLLEALFFPNPNHPSLLVASEYEDNDMGSFLTKVAVLDIVN